MSLIQSLLAAAVGLAALVAIAWACGLFDQNPHP